jgi:integrase
MSGTRVSPFLRGNVWWARIPRLGSDPVQRSLGVSGEKNRDVANAICAFLRWLRDRRESFLLDALATGKAKIGEAHTAYVENRLDAFVSELRDGVRDEDIEPLVARWQRELERKKKPNADTRAKYLRQVRTLIVEGKPYRRSQFTKQRIREWLSALTIDQPNRYRAALSSFAEFLMFEDVIATNVVLQVAAAAENEPRTLHLGQLDAKKLVGKFDAGSKLQALHALMLATGMEFGAARVVDPATATETSVYAAGTKTRVHRKRTCTIYPRWRWAWDIAQAELSKHADGSQPFKGISVHQSARALIKALAAATLTDEYTQHDHRHTWAVQAIRDGIPLHVVAHQLGHRDPTMTLRVYGRFVPSSSDYRNAMEPKPEPNATISATVPVQVGSETERAK